ncbi:Nif3-like dinuclear metal center hexameric protein [Erysipelotrichaceae bacterium OttesenSCG-928-M19]|nr:Nif3-like dinuclear metal center hexameric protein [Erysipelotrichaceae bacterium OttesenSCG-928-M19]
MKLDDLLTIIEKEYPQEQQFEWDCSGLLIKQDEVNKVIVCLDITPKVAQYALENNVDLIISHHPLIFMDYPSSPEYIREIFQELYANKIAVYSMHTNYDSDNHGMNDLFVRLLNYQRIDNDEIVMFNADSLIYKKLHDFFNYPLRVYNKKDDIKKVAVVLGSGGSYIEDVIAAKCDMFISSEFKHHEILQANINMITLVDVAHQAEMIFVNDIVTFLNEKSITLEVIPFEDYYTIS